MEEKILKLSELEKVLQKKNMRDTDSEYSSENDENGSDNSFEADADFENFGADKKFRRGTDAMNLLKEEQLMDGDSLDSSEVEFNND